MTTKGTNHIIDRCISGILYTLLLVAAFTFYTSTADVFDTIIEKDLAERWYNSSGTLIISVIVWIYLTVLAANRIKRNPAILTEDVVRKFILTATTTLFCIMPIYVAYHIFDRYLHGEYRIGFYGIQCLKLITASIIGSYFFRTLNHRQIGDNTMTRTIGILLALEGLVLFSVNLYHAPSIDELRLQSKDKDKATHLRKADLLVEDYLRQHKKVPKSLDEINLSTTERAKAFTDPVSDQPFTYARISDTEAAICTDFYTNSQDKYLDFLAHPITKNSKEKCRRIEKPKDEDRLKYLGSY